MQRYKISALLLSFLLLLPILNNSKLFAQEDYLFENLNVADGLSSSSLNAFQNIFQDKYGFIWFGTSDGLNRYDGYNFKIYKNMPGDTNSLPSSNIQLITEDDDGNLWIGTVGKMSRLDRKKDTFKNYNIENGNSLNTRQINIVRSIIDSKKNFWIGTQGRSVQKWNKEKERWEIVPFMMEVAGSDSLVKSLVNAVFAICELRNGNILASDWMGGIFYYNEISNRFEPFKFINNENPNNIVEIFEDRSGKIWFGGKDAFMIYNPKSFSFEYKDDWKKYKGGSGDNYFFNINQREDGSLLMCSIPFGILKYDPSTEKFEKLRLGSLLENRGIGKFTSNKIIDKSGIYWIGLGDNGILKFDPNRKPFNYYSLDDDKMSQSFNSITSGIKINSQNHDELIVSTFGNGVYKFDLTNRKFTKLNINLPSIYSDSTNLNSFVIDDKNKIWFPSSFRNISNYDLITGKSETFNILSKAEITGGNERISSVEYLPKNEIVISSNSGVYLFNTDSKKLENIPTVMNRKYSEEFISTIKNVLSENKNLASFTKVGEAANLSKKFTLEKESKILVVCLGEGQYPEGIFDFGNIKGSDEKSIWAMDSIPNTFNGGGGYKNRLQIDVISLKPGNYSINYATDVGHSYGNFNVKIPNNPEWYGIQTVLLDNSTAEKLEKMIQNEKDKNNTPDIFKSRFTTTSRKYPSSLWIGADEKGIIKYDLNSRKFNQYKINASGQSVFTVNLIFEDSKGRLWITIDPTGFFRFDSEKKELISNSDIPDLPMTGINSIIEDFNGSIWINSNSGITKLSENNDGSWTSSNYDSKDGVQGGFGAGSLIDKNGEIFFGSYNGITAFYPSKENTSPPIPIITNITVSDLSVFDKNSSVDLDESIYDMDNLNLSYAQNDVSFDFSALHYSRPSKNRVSYMLEGFNDHWIFTDKNYASFTNLEPGEYKLRIKAFSGFGVPSESERIIDIIIAPPWYRTTIAYISYGLLFVGIVFGIDRIQRRRLLHREREKQKIQEAELRAIAAEAQSRAVQAENERKTKELEEARQLQLSMLPKHLPELPHLDIAVYMKTATEVGGDYYDFHVALDGTLTVVIGDATGHGMRAGTMVTAAKSLFSTHASNPDILYTFAEISRCLKHMDMHLLTMCMSVLKIQKNKMIMSSAGMPPTLIYREANREVEEITLKGMPLGAVYKFPYTIKETELDSGDTILLMSDGYPELFNDDKELFGYGRVEKEFSKIARKSPSEIIENLKDSASDWVGNKEPNDDVTFVVIKVK